MGDRRAPRRRGAQLAFTFQGERIEKSVRDLAATVDTKLVTPCDVAPTTTSTVSSPETADAFGGGLDVLVHSVAFAAAEDLEGRFTDTPRDRFWMAVDISAYSLVACAKRAEPLMEARGGGSIVTMTYLGGVRAVPHYNVMGVAKATLDASMRYLAWDLGAKQIRVDAISAGPVRTLAARSIAGFTTMEDMFEQRAPLHRPIESGDCGAAAAYLLGRRRNVTGTTLYVDAGYHAMGMWDTLSTRRFPARPCRKLAHLGRLFPPVSAARSGSEATQAGGQRSRRGGQQRGNEERESSGHLFLLPRSLVESPTVSRRRGDVRRFLRSPKFGKSGRIGHRAYGTIPRMTTTALIVDDHPSFRRFARKLLEAAEVRVVGDAGDGASALSRRCASCGRTSYCWTCCCRI